jgi:hypothetical protein
MACYYSALGVALATSDREDAFNEALRLLKLVGETDQRLIEQAIDDPSLYGLSKARSQAFADIVGHQAPDIWVDQVDLDLGDPPQARGAA